MANEVLKHNSASGCFGLYCITKVQQQGITNAGAILGEYVAYLVSETMILLLIMFTES